MMGIKFSSGTIPLKGNLIGGRRATIVIEDGGEVCGLICVCIINIKVQIEFR